MKHEFGWLPIAVQITESDFAISPLPDFAEVVRAVQESEHVERDWFYPPPLEGPPIRACEYFQLPPTHVLETTKPEDEVNFLITVLGFLEGLRLVPARWINFYRAYLKPHMMVGFDIEESALVRILRSALSRWAVLPPETRTKLFGALHWHMFSRSYEHTFEVFSAQYTVLDTCWRIHVDIKMLSDLEYLKRLSKNNCLGHQHRPIILAEAYGLTVPVWAELSSDKKSSYVSRLRNSLVHEALFEGAPISFAFPKKHPSIHFELACFNTRLLLALLGEDNFFVHTPIYHSMTRIT